MVKVLREGFSLLELILGLAILGLICMVIGQKWSLFTVDLDIETQQLANQIRHTQRLATVRQQTCGLHLTPHSYQVYCQPSAQHGPLRDAPQSLSRRTQLQSAHRDIVFDGQGHVRHSAHLSLTRGAQQRHITIEAGNARINVQ